MEVIRVHKLSREIPMGLQTPLTERCLKELQQIRAVVITARVIEIISLKVIPIGPIQIIKDNLLLPFNKLTALKLSYRMPMLGAFRTPR